MLTCAPLWALQEIGVVLPRTAADFGRIVRVAAAVTAVLTAGIAVLAFTPLGGLLLGAAFHLTPDIERAVVPALGLLVLEPAALATRALSHGVMLRARRTGAFLAFAPLRLAVMLAAGLATAAALPGANGAALGLALVVGGDVVDAAMCAARARQVLAAGAFAPPGDAGAIPEAETPALRSAA
jgi:hypothetical protein